MIHVFRIIYLSEIVEIGDSEIEAIRKQLNDFSTPLGELKDSHIFHLFLRDYLQLRPMVERIEFIEDDYDT